MKQFSFASLNYMNKKITTKREKFLNEMEQAVPWKRLLALIDPYYPKAGNGRSPNPMETMLRIYFLQQWYALSDPGAEEALYDMESMRRFAHIDLTSDTIPDESSILNFRRLIETHHLSVVIFEDINAYLVDQGVRLSKGSMVDATIITAPSSTQNQKKQRDPEMHSTRKNNQYYFGMKVHIGTDVNSNAIHSATVTAANVADIDEMPKHKPNTLFNPKRNNPLFSLKTQRECNKKPFLDVEDFSRRTVHSVKQDVHASALVPALIAMECFASKGYIDGSVHNRKHRYKINFAVAIQSFKRRIVVMLNYRLNITDLFKWLKEIARNLTIIKPERSFERDKVRCRRKKLRKGCKV